MMHEDTLLYLLLDLAIIIAAARLLGAAARRIGQPAVIGEVAAGILLGPTVLGRLNESWPGELFPSFVPLRSIADLGLIFFMFLVGLELDSNLVRRQGRRAVQISLSGIAGPAVLGALLGLLVYSVNAGGNFAEGVDKEPTRLAFSLFLGAAMCITAFPILARILVETGLYKTPVGIATLCAAAVDDVVAWILLATVVGIVENGNASEAARALLLTAVFAAFMFVVVRRLLEAVARRYDSTGRLSVDQVAIVVAGILLSALATEEIGIHAIFGAFIFGAIMPRRSGMTKELTDKVEDFTIVVLLPIFFLVTGLRTDLFRIDSISLLGWLLLILSVAVAGKFIGCGVAARLTGSSRREAVIVGALMNTRGLTELVILTIGFELGVLSDQLFAMMVVMALATTVMAAPIVNRLMPRERILREIAAAEGVSEIPLATRVLVAVGNPLNAAALVDVGIRLTGRRRPAELLLVRLIPTTRAPEFRSGLRDEEREIEASVASMRRLVEQAAAAGVTARPLSFLSDDVGRDLARLGRTQRCDLILTGWHRPSLPAQVIRTLVRRVFALASCDVVVFVDRAGNGLPPPAEQPIVLALAGSEHDAGAERIALRLAEKGGGPLTVVGYLGEGSGREATEDSERIALRTDEIRRESGTWAVPKYAPGEGALAAALDEGPGALAAVVGVGVAWQDDDDFGAPADGLAVRFAGPVLVVRAGGATGVPQTLRSLFRRLRRELLQAGRGRQQTPAAG